MCRYAMLIQDNWSITKIIRHRPLYDSFFISPTLCVCVVMYRCEWVALCPPAVSPTVSDSLDTLSHTLSQTHTHTMENVKRSIFLWHLPLEVKGQVQKNILHGKHICRRSLALPHPLSLFVFYTDTTYEIKNKSVKKSIIFSDAKMMNTDFPLICE